MGKQYNSSEAGNTVSGRGDGEHPIERVSMNLYFGVWVVVMGLVSILAFVPVSYAIAENPKPSSIIALMYFACFFGLAVGLYVLWIHSRYVVLEWDSEGLACHTGLVDPAHYRWPWSDLEKSFLFIEQIKYVKVFRFVIVLPQEIVVIDNAQLAFRSVDRLINAIRQHADVETSKLERSKSPRLRLLSTIQPRAGWDDMLHQYGLAQQRCE